MFLEGELLSHLILRSEVLIELLFGPIDEDIGLPRRVGGRDCRSALLSHFHMHNNNYTLSNCSMVVMKCSVMANSVRF